MKLIEYQIEIKFMRGNKEVKLQLSASSAEELCKKIQKVLGENSKWNILKFFKS